MIAPATYARDRLGLELWGKQREILDAIIEHRRVTVRSGHGVGKTLVAASLACWFLAEHNPCIVITTAPTNRQVEKVMWPEIRKLWRRTLLGKAGIGTVNLKEIRISDTRSALGFSTDLPDAFQGFHSPNMLFIADEAAGIPPEIFEAAQGILTGDNVYELLIGNPTTPSGDFFISHQPGSPYHRIAVSCLESPNVVERENLIPGLVSWEWCNKRLHEWGESSPTYQSRVLGQFPEHGIDSLFSRAWLDAAASLTTDISATGLRMGVDVARYGSDNTVLVVCNDSGVIDVISRNGLATTEVAGLAIATAKRYNVSGREISVDDTGLGGGVTDALREAGWYVNAVNFGSTATDEIYDGVRTEMYMRLAKTLNPDEGGGHFAMPPCANDISQQIADMQYRYTSRGKMKLESKDDIKKRLGRSPDDADALALCFAPKQPSSFVVS